MPFRISPQETYQVRLQVFEGPLDLLLHLIEREELDITRISLAQVTDQYLAHIDRLEKVHAENLADFLVVAAKLLLIKSQMLLPRPESTAILEEEEDPGAQLVRHLLQYKELKEAAEHLGHRARAQGEKFARPQQQAEGAEEDDNAAQAVLEDLSTWDLMVAFAQVVQQTQLTRPIEIVNSDVPITTYVEEVLAHLRASLGPVDFLDFFLNERSRERIIGIFLALLELARQRAIHVEETEGQTRRIQVSLRKAG